MLRAVDGKLIVPRKVILEISCREFFKTTGRFLKKLKTTGRFSKFLNQNIQRLNECFYSCAVILF